MGFSLFANLVLNATKPYTNTLAFIRKNKKPILKFLREIREKLLTKNQFSKYLRYIIGEIALVVIGILIAAPINNWKRKDRWYEQGRNIITLKIKISHITD